MLDCPDTKISSFQQLRVQRNPCLFLWHFRSACGLSVENKCIKSRSFPNTNTVTYVHMCFLCFWYFSWVFSKFYIQYSRSPFPLSSLGSTRGTALALRNVKRSSWDHTRGEYLGFLGTSVKDFSSYGIPVSTSMDLRENSSRISLCKYIFPDLELWNLRKIRPKTEVGKTNTFHLSQEYD